VWYNGAHCYAGLALRVLFVLLNHGRGTLVVQMVFARLMWNEILELQGIAPGLKQKMLIFF
jgi:hypothetical protein